MKSLTVGGWIFEYVAYGSFAVAAFATAAQASAAFEATLYFGP